MKKRREDPEFRKKQAEREKKWREDNPDKAKASAAASIAKNLESYTCVCGCSTSKRNEVRHLDTKKHKEFVKNKLVI